MRCPACGRQSDDDPDVSFCARCGSPLWRPEGDDGAGTGQRKIVSVVFCDLVGYTARVQRMDPEPLQDLMRAFYDCVIPVYDRFGASTRNIIGDAVVGTFGDELVHEDDAERAVRAALGILEAIRAANAATPSLDFSVHIGVATGEALVTRGIRGVAKEAWSSLQSTAQRLETAAGPDAALVDDTTYRATRHVIEYEPVAPVVAKGIAEPVLAWRPLRTRAAQVMEAEDAAAPLRGRDAELGLIERVLDDVLVRRAQRFVAIAGEAGIGKSRLVLELYRRLESREELVTWRHGRSSTYVRGAAARRTTSSTADGVTFSALADVVRQQAGIRETDDAEEVRCKLARAVDDLAGSPAEAARVEHHLRALLGLRTTWTERDEPGPAFAAWRHFLEGLARRRPLVLVFEDLHEEDAGMLDFVDHLAAWTADVPLLVVCTSRTAEASWGARWPDREQATSIRLERLPEPEVRALVRDRLGRGAPRAQEDAIIAEAAGNPLYSVELVRALAQAPGQHPAGAEAASPSRLGRIMDARIDALPDEHKAALQAAAAIGRAVWPGAVAAITARPEPSVVSRLDALASDQFLAREGSSYRFEHGLLRERAFASIPRARLARMHLGVADWLESLSPDRAGERAEMLAHHLWEAHGHPAVQSALTPRVARALRAAGDRAAALQAFGVARGYFAKARDLWPDDEPDRPELLLRLGKAAYQAGALQEATETLPAASDALRAAGQPGLAGEAEACLTYIAHGNGRHDEMRRHMDRAMTLVEGLGPTQSKAEVLVDLAIMLSLERDHERTLAAGREALGIARELGLPELEASALSAIGVSRGLAGDLGGRDDLRRSVEITEDLGSHLSAHCLGMLADLEGQLGDLESCFALQERARRHAERFGHAAHVHWFEAEGIGRDFWTGDWEAALVTADDFIARADAGSPTFMTGYCRIMRGRIRLARDDLAGALDDAGRAVAFAREAEDLQMLYPALAFQAHAAAVAGGGAEEADALLGMWRAQPDAYPVSAWGADLAYALDEQGRAGALEAVARTASIETRWLDALLPYAAGDFAAAADGFARVGSRADEAAARLRAAETLRDAGAARELERATAMLRQLGATRLLRRAADVRFTGSAQFARARTRV